MKTKLKKIISILVCVMMVSLTFPVNVLGSVVFAQNDVQVQAVSNEVEHLDDGQEISMEGGEGGARTIVVSSLKELQKAIKQANPGEQTLIALTKDITTSNGWFSSPEYSLECEAKSIIITSANPSSPQTIQIGSTKSGLLRAKNSDVTLENINITGISTPDQTYGCAEDKHIRSAIRVEGGSITIGEGVKFSKYSKIDSRYRSDRSHGNFIWCDKGTVNIESGEFSYCGSNNSTGSVVYCSGGTVNINGGFFHNCSADRGIIFSDRATVNITGGTFNKCRARCGSVAFADGGNVKISAGSFEECKETAISLFEATLTMTGGNFVNCFSAQAGAIEVSSGSYFTMTGGKISGCSGGSGGAICVAKDAAYDAIPGSKGSTFIMRGGEISGCHASGVGGAIYVDEDCVARLEEGTITSCSAYGTLAVGYGSAICVCYTSTLSIAKKESGLFKILDIRQGKDTDFHSCAGYYGIYLDERPAGETGRQHAEVIELDPPSPEDNNGAVLEAGSWEDLENAINKAQDGDTIKLTKELIIDEYASDHREFMFEVCNKKITITAGNPSNKISRAYTKDIGLLKIKGKNASVTLENIEIENNDATMARTLIGVTDGGCLNIGKNVKIYKYNSAQSSMIYCDGGATVNFNGGEISECRACIIRCVGSTVNINGGKISKCFGGEKGAICCEYNATVNIYGGKISDCIAKQGGAIYCEEGGIVHIKRGEISVCGAQNNGGAVFCDRGGIVNIDGGKISVCVAQKSGGAIYCSSGGRVIIDGGKISNCDAQNSGGAIYCSSGGRVNMNGGEISGCEAKCGGAIYINFDGKLDIRGGNINNCAAECAGDAIFLCHFDSLLYIPSKESGLLTITLTGGHDQNNIYLSEPFDYPGIYVVISRSVPNGNSGDNGSSFDSDNSVDDINKNIGKRAIIGDIIPNLLYPNTRSVRLFNLRGFDESTTEDGCEQDDDIDMIDECNEFENAEYEDGQYDENDRYDEDDEIENDKGSGEKEKNDGLGVLVPWLIGAAVISIGAVAVVFVLKNKGAN